jgi:alpha-beta hydrolase superfamily lysophospholipase
MRLGLVAVLSFALILAACSREPEAMHAPAAKPVPPELLINAIRMDDGAMLPLRTWMPKGNPRWIVLALHGFNDYSHAFEDLGKAFAEQGMATYAYDQRGFGDAPDRGLWAGTWRLAQDLAEAAKLLRARWPDVPLVVLGESMGGAVAIVAETGAAGTEKPGADAYVLLAPAVWGRSYLNVFERGVLWLAYNVVPGVTLTGQSLHIMASDNIEMLRELSRDPKVIKETRVGTIEGLVDLMTMAQNEAPKFDARALILYGGHDEIIPEAPVRDFVNNLPPAKPGRRRVAWYPHGYHMLARDLEAQTVLADIISWIYNPKASLPSGADQDLPKGWK